MKLLYLTSICLVFFFSANAKTECDSAKTLTIIFLNDNAMRPIALTSDDFWKSRQLSKINFEGAKYYDLVKYRLSKNKKDSELNGFSVSAVIILSDGQKKDTLYTTYFFNDWLVGAESFTSTDNFLYKMFNPLYLGRFTLMKTGDD